MLPVFPAEINNVFNLEFGRAHVMIAVASQYVHLRPLHWETVSFVAPVKLTATTQQLEVLLVQCT